MDIPAITAAGHARRRGRRLGPRARRGQRAAAAARLGRRLGRVVLVQVPQLRARARWPARSCTSGTWPTARCPSCEGWWSTDAATRFAMGPTVDPGRHRRLVAAVQPADPRDGAGAGLAGDVRRGRHGGPARTQPPAHRLPGVAAGRGCRAAAARGASRRATRPGAVRSSRCGSRGSDAGERQRAAAARARRDRGRAASPTSSGSPRRRCTPRTTTAGGRRPRWRRWSMADEPGRGRRRRAGRLPAGDACWPAAGWPSTVYERRPDPRLAGAERGRSINLAISARGLDALEPGRAATSSRSAERCRCTAGWSTRATAAQSFQPYSADGDPGDQLDQPGRAEPRAARRRRGQPGRHGALRAPADRSWTLDRGQLPVRDAGRACRRARRCRAGRATGPYSAARRAVTFRPGFDLQPGLPRPRLQGADDPGARRRLRARPGRAAHLAARHVDDDRAAQPRPLVHLHAVLAAGRSFAALRHARRGARGTSGEHYPDVVAADARRWPTTTCTTRSGSLVTVRCRPWVHHGTRRRSRSSATPRTRSCRSSGRARTARSRTASSSTAA